MDETWRKPIETKCQFEKLKSGEVQEIAFLIGEKQTRVNVPKLLLTTHSTVFNVMFQRLDQENSLVPIPLIIIDETVEVFQLFLDVSDVVCLNV